MGRSAPSEDWERLEASPVTVELLLFFHRNPSTIDRLEGISTWLGRRPEHLRPALERLIQMGILQTVGRSPRRLYRYSHDPTIRERVRQWLERRGRKPE